MRALLCLALALWASLASADRRADPAELARTWQSAAVYLPGGRGRVGVHALPAYLRAHPEARIVLYAHGCAGLSHIDHHAGRFHSGLGHVFVAPDGAARVTKPASCQPLLRKGGLHRAVLGWRQAEIDHALRRLRALAPAAPIALVGHSEGGITVATLRTLPVAARVIEGWTCHAYWPEYEGLHAPAGEPVLALVGADDPWFPDPDLRGNCAPFMDANDRSYVFRAPDPLHDKHWLTSGEAGARSGGGLPCRNPRPLKPHPIQQQRPRSGDTWAGPAAAIPRTGRTSPSPPLRSSRPDRPQGRSRRASDP